MTDAGNARSWPVMLAQSAPATAEVVQHYAGLGDWVADWKWDGVRCLAVVEDGTVTLVNRRGTDITYRYPEVAGALATWHPRVVLDGELVVFDPATGLPSFKLVHQRDAFGPARERDIARYAAALPATFVAFDCLAAEQRDDIRSWCQAFRLKRLDDLFGERPGSARVAKSLRTDDIGAMLDVVTARGSEGLILKHLQAPYQGGRSRDWMKLKPTRTVTCEVTGWTKGTGARAETFGALLIGVRDRDGQLVDLGKVGSGFSAADIACVDPFVRAGLPLFVEVEYQERQPDSGVLRFPRFKGIRWDIDSAGVDQLEPERLLT